MKYFLILTLTISSQAFAGNGGSSMRAGPDGRGCTDHHFPNHQPTVVTFNITQPPAPTVIHVDASAPAPAPPAPAPAPVPPAPSLSEIKANELRDLYTSFSGMTDVPSETQVGAFVTNTSQILLRYPEHNPIAKRSWSAEDRLAYKILFGMICYIGNLNDTEVSTWLSREAGLTSGQMAELDQFRSCVGVERRAAMVAFTMNAPLCQRTPLEGIVSTFLNRL